MFSFRDFRRDGIFDGMTAYSASAGCLSLRARCYICDRATGTVVLKTVVVERGLT